MCAGGEHLVIDKDGVVVAGNAAVLLEPLFLIDAALSAAGEEVFARIGGPGLFVDFLDEAGADRIVDVDAMMGPAHGIAAFLDVAKYLVEDGVGATMGRDDGESPAPGGGWFGVAIEEALVWMKGEFVELDVATSRGDGVNAGREGVDALAGGEAEDPGFEVLFGIDNTFAKVLGSDLKDGGPLFADLEVVDGGLLIF